MTEIQIVKVPYVDEAAWLDAGREIADRERRTPWDIGDWWAHGVQRGYGTGKATVKALGLDYGDVARCASVARAFESLRRRKLSFAHHAEVAALPPEQGDAWLDTAEAEGWNVKDLRAAIREADPTRNQWFTPAWLFDQLGVTFDIDVCAPEDRTHAAVPAHYYYTAAIDGLAQDWHGLVWCNPPYSDPEAWADRMIEHGNGLLLVHMPNNAHWATRVQWAATAARLIQSMHFTRPDGTDQRPGYSLMLLAFGDLAAQALRNVEGERVGPYWRQTP